MTWRPPENSVVRINFDAFLKQHENRSCSGMIIRNSECNVLGSKTIINENIPSIFTAKNPCMYPKLDVWPGSRALGG